MTRRRQRPRPDYRPTPALPRAWAPVIARASRRLSGDTKLLFALLVELDRPKGQDVGGVWMSEGELAAQLGLSVDHVSNLRRHLVALGLLNRRDVGTWHYWFPTLPEIVEPTPPAGASSEDVRRWLRYQAEALDRHIDETEARTRSQVTRDRERARARRERAAGGAPGAAADPRSPPPDGTADPWTSRVTTRGLHGSPIPTAVDSTPRHPRSPRASEHDTAPISPPESVSKDLSTTVESLRESDSARARPQQASATATPGGRLNVARLRDLVPRELQRPTPTQPRDAEPAAAPAPADEPDVDVDLLS